MINSRLCTKERSGGKGPSSIPQWSSSEAHVSIVYAFGGGQRGNITGLPLCSPIGDKLRCSVYSDAIVVVCDIVGGLEMAQH